MPGSAGGFAPAIAVAVGTMPYNRIGTTDLNGDGALDLLAPGHNDSTVRLIQGGRPPRLLEPAIRLGGKPWMVLGADVNGDRAQDVIVVQTDAVSIWLAGRTGFRPAPRSPFALRGATDIATGDLDGDKIDDVAIGPWDGDTVTIIAAE